MSELPIDLEQGPGLWRKMHGVSAYSPAAEDSGESSEIAKALDGAAILRVESTGDRKVTRGELHHSLPGAHDPEKVVGYGPRGLKSDRLGQVLAGAEQVLLGDSSGTTREPRARVLRIAFDPGVCGCNRIVEGGGP